MSDATNSPLRQSPDHRQRYDEFVRLRQEHPPAILYKYVTLDTAFRIFASGRVLFNSPLQYNDPFDSQWNTLWPLDTPEAEQAERRYLKQLIEDPTTRADLPADVREELEQSLKKDLQNQTVDSIIDDIISSRSDGDDAASARQRDMIRRMRVFCTSEHPRSTLMWSHYGDHHRGVVIAFRTDRLGDHWCVPAERVKYSKALPVLIDVDAWAKAIVFGEDAIQKAVGMSGREWALAKDMAWEYEAEWRFACIAPRGTESTSELFLLCRGCVEGLIFGCRCDKSMTASLSIMAAAFSDSLRVSYLEMHPREYSLIEDRVEYWICTA